MSSSYHRRSWSLENKSLVEDQNKVLGEIKQENSERSGSLLGATSVDIVGRVIGISSSHYQGGQSKKRLSRHNGCKKCPEDVT